MTAMSDGRLAQERTPRGAARPEPRRRDLHRLELSGSALLGGAEGASLATRLAGLSGVSTIIANPLTERAVVLFDPAAIGIDGIGAVFEAQGVDLDRTVARWHLPIAGLACARCAGRVEEAVGPLPGVRAAIVNGDAESLTVEFILGRTDLETVQATLLAQGFDHGRSPRPTTAATERPHDGPAP